jgi:hypothetical protein
LWLRRKNDRRRGGGNDLYGVLQCPKEYVLFAASEGAGEHCEAGAREVFFQKMFGWFVPSWPDGRVANDAVGNLIETHAHKGRVARFDDCKEIASTRGVRCELSTAARFWLAQAGQAQTSQLSPQLNYGGRNYEKNAIDHCLGSSGVVCVGTDPTAAAYEDARRAEAAAANHKHDHHRY